MRTETIIVYGKPKGKQRPRFAGHAYTPKETKAYEASIAAAWEGAEPFNGNVAVTITMLFEMPKSWSKKKREEMDGKYAPRKPDTDNCEKAVFDALVRCGAIKDDVYIVRNMTVKQWTSSLPCIEVKVRDEEW